MFLIGGIRNTGVAYDTCLVKPYLFAENAAASSYTVTPKGRISVSWKYSDGRFSAEIEIPEGCSATLEVLNKKIALKSGENKIFL